MSRRRMGTCALVALLAGWVAVAGAAGGSASITVEDLRSWLSYIASDELQGRDTYSAGLGLAAGYIQEHLRGWGAVPDGDPGQYLQTVRVLGVKTTSRSTVTVKVGNEARTFKDGEGVTFPRNAGATRTLTADRVEFAGYGLDVPAVNHMDFRGRDVKGAAVIFLGASGPRGVDAATYRRLLTGRNRYATDQKLALASIGPEAPSAGTGRGGANAAGPGAGRGRGGAAPDFTTAQRLDQAIAPSLTANDAFFTFLFGRAKQRYATSSAWRRRATTCHRSHLTACRSPSTSTQPMTSFARSSPTTSWPWSKAAILVSRIRMSRLVPTTITSGIPTDSPAGVHRAASRPARRTISSGTAPTTTGREPWR